MDISLPNDFTPRDYQRRFMRAMGDEAVAKLFFERK